MNVKPNTQNATLVDDLREFIMRKVLRIKASVPPAEPEAATEKV